MNITKYINMAVAEADKSDFEYRHGVIICRGSKVIGRGHNRLSATQEKVSKRYGVEFFSLHAEMAALLDCDDVTDATMFVSGKKFNGNPINCKPCKKCAKILKHIGIQVYYTNRDGVHLL